MRSDVGSSSGRDDRELLIGIDDIRQRTSESLYEGFAEVGFTIMLVEIDTGQ